MSALSVQIKGYPNTKILIKLPKVNPPLKKFIVNFRRPDDYTGKYGFDWLRDEYIYPINFINNDNNGTPIGTHNPLCKNISALKNEYKTKDVKNIITPYGREYFPAWLSIFPSTTTAQFKYGSSMHKNGVDLDLEIEEIEVLAKDGTQLLFECSNNFIEITPKKINLKDLINNKLSKLLGSSIGSVDYYKAEKKINIKCKNGALNNHEEIKVFAKLGNKKEEVGKLMLYKNNVIPKAEIVAVNVITNTNSASLRDDYQYLFKNQSFNQALIRAEVKVDTKFDINSLPSTDTDVINFKNNYINSISNIGRNNASSFKKDLISLYEKFGKHIPSGSLINSNTNKRTYLFYTTIKAETSGTRVQGSCSAKYNFNAAGVATGITWGNAYIILAQR